MFETVILAGGLSRRMGRSKARLRLGGRTMLARVRATAAELGAPVRVVRRDLVPRCGPLGGIYTALATTRADAVLVLACDMPFVSARLLRRVVARAGNGRRALFATSPDGPGFPIWLPRSALPVVTRQIERQDFSLQALARVSRAARLRLPANLATQLRNLNTPDQLRAARKAWASKTSRYSTTASDA